MSCRTRVCRRCWRSHRQLQPPQPPAAAPAAPACPRPQPPEGCPDSGPAARPGLVLQEHREPEHSRTPGSCLEERDAGAKAGFWWCPGAEGAPLPAPSPGVGEIQAALPEGTRGKAQAVSCPHHSTAAPRHQSHTALGAVVTGQQHPHTGGVTAPGTALRINPHASSIVVKHLFVKVI